jgi:hypothetical protein
MLIIEKGENTPLPKSYHATHNICAYLYDHLTEVISDVYYLEMATTLFDPPLPEAAGNAEFDHLDYLAKHNRHNELEIVITKHLVMSMIGDMSNFLYESLRIAKSGKMSVAYALLRKPFTDQLLIFEQLLIDRKDFIERFYHSGEPKQYDPSDRTIDKKAIVDKAVDMLNTIDLYNADLLYELRFDRSSPISINGITNKALHIVTNDKGYPTQKQDLNFIFNAPDRVEDQWKHYYFVMPLLLSYVGEVIDRLVFTLIKDKEGRHEFKALERMLAFAMVFHQPSDKATNNMIRHIGKMLETECPICREKNRFSKAYLTTYFFEGEFFCKRCHNAMKLDEGAHLRLKNLFINDI